MFDSPVLSITCTKTCFSIMLRIFKAEVTLPGDTYDVNIKMSLVVIGGRLYVIILHIFGAVPLFLYCFR